MFMDCQFRSPSSSATFVPSSLKNETILPRKFIFSPRKTHFPSWVSQISVRNCVRGHLQLKSSNGHPLNAVFLPDGGYFLHELYFLIWLNCLSLEFVYLKINFPFFSLTSRIFLIDEAAITLDTSFWYVLITLSEIY